MDILTSIETVMDSDLLHYGRQGMKWGVRNGPPYPLHPEQLSPAEKKARRSVFISGSSKTQFEDSGYYRKELPKAIQNKIDDYIKDHARIIVGDAPGIDRQVQDYLNEKGYDAVEVYGPGKQVRYAANDKWKTNPVDAPEFEEMSPEWLRKKDIAMTNDATEGLAIVLDDGAQATRNNVARLREQGKQAEVFILGKDGDDDFESETGSYVQSSKKIATERAKKAWNTHGLVDDIINSMSADDRYKVLAGDDHYLNKEEGSHVVKRSITKANGKAASFIDLLDDGKQLQVAIGTRAGDDYRGKGYGYKAAKNAIKWYEQHKYELPYEEIVWGVLRDNYGSIRIAEKLGFEKDETSISDDGKWINYVKKTNKVSHAETLFAEFVQAEDLEHHGRKGMKWGVRNGPPYPLQYSKMSPEERQKIPRPKLTKKEEAAYKEQIESKEAATAAKRTAAHRKNRMTKVGLNQNEDGSYTLKEGSNIRRVSSEDDDKRSSAKYVSVTSADAKVYDDDVYELGMEEGQTPYTYEFKAKKDLRIANEDDVLDFLLDKYGNDTNRADVEAYQKQRGKDQIYVNAKHGKAEGWLWDYAFGVEKLARTFVHRELYDIDRVHQREVLDHFSSLGYDAIMDIEDRINRFDAPILIIDPESSMAQTHKEKWEDYNLKKSYKNSLSHSDFLSAVELVLPDDALQYGVLGQKWGIRKWQNKDGTLTPAGRERWINSLKQEAYAASKKWEEYQKVRKQVIDMHYDGKFDNELETKMLRLKNEAEEAGAIWGSLRKRIESYLENGPDVSTSEPVEDAPHKVLIPVSDEKKYQHFLDLGYVEKGRNNTWIYMVNHKKYVKHSDTNQNDVLTAVETVMDGDIEHHGRMGQKWGIRNGPPYPLDPDRLSARERMLDKEGKNIAATGPQKGWQKSKLLTEFAKVPYTGALDARLTKLGRKHMAEMLSKKELQKWGEANKQSREHSLKKAGIQKSEEGGHTMKVGSKLYRIADATDQVDDKRKYVSATENDKERYNETFNKGFLGLHKRDSATEFQYEGQKDIRVADADDVLGYVVDKYGGKREKQLLADVRRAEQFQDVLKELNVTRLGTAADVAVANYLANTAPMELRSFVKSQLWDGSSEQGKKVYAGNKQSEILGHYKDLGYDAIVDVEDYLSGYEYPMIMIDPKKSISTKQKRALDPDMEDPERRVRLTEAGVKRQSSSDDVIAKGTTFTRQATANDDQYHDRKYMSVTKKDTDYYRKEFGDEAEYRYEAKKKLKVASAKAVVDYIVKDMNNYGDSEEGKQLSALYDKYRGKTDGWIWQIKANKERDRFENEVVAKQRTKYGRESETEFNSQKQILDHFSQLGYDAIVDINQSWQGMDYPVIIIDPDNSTKLKTKITKRTFKDKVENY